MIAYITLRFAYLCLTRPSFPFGLHHPSPREMHRTWPAPCDSPQPLPPPSRAACSSLACEPANGCMCASNSPPGTLNALSVPQFIVLTNDDAVTAATQALILNVTERHSNPNACKIPATWFVTAEGSNATLLSKLYARGHSISTNGAKLKANPTVDEIIAGKLWLNQSAGIPMEDVTGFRAPFQLFTPAQRAALSANGFRYDSSITELVGTTTSPAKDQLLWPYTMDYGIPQSCSVAGGVCTTSERYAGLWEFPMWTTYDESGNNAGAMDPAVVRWKDVGERGVPWLKLTFRRRICLEHCPLE